MKDYTAKDAWEKSIEEAFIVTNLKGDDINAIKSLGKMLGNTNIERTSKSNRVSRNFNGTKNKRSRGGKSEKYKIIQDTRSYIGVWTCDNSNLKRGYIRWT